MIAILLLAFLPLEASTNRVETVAANAEISCNVCRLNVIVNDDAAGRQEFAAVYAGSDDENFKAVAFIADRSFPVFTSVVSVNRLVARKDDGFVCSAIETTYDGGVIRVGDIRVNAKDRLIMREIHVDSKRLKEIEDGTFNPFALYGKRLKPISWDEYKQLREAVR